MINRKSFLVLLLVLTVAPAVGQKFPFRELNRPGSEFYTVSFNPDSRLLASGDQQGKIHLWDVTANQVVNVLEGPAEKMLKLAFSSDGNFVAGAGKSAAIYVWSVRYGINEKILQGHEGIVTSIAFSPDSRYIVAASTDKKVLVWDFVTGKVLHTLAAHAKEISDIRFTRDGKLFAIAGYDGKTFFYNTANFQLEKMISPEAGRIRSVAFTPDGKFVALSSEKKGVLIYEIYSGYLSRSLPMGKDFVYDMAFSPDGQYLFCGTLDSFLYAFSTTSEEKLTLPGTLYQFISLSASADGTMLAVADASSKLRLYDLADLKIKGDKFTSVRNTNVITDGIHLELLEPFHPFDSAYAAPTSRLRVKGIVSAKNGLSELRINNKIIPVSPAGLFETELTIPAGRWEIPVVARDYNNTLVAKRIITVRDAKDEDSRFRNGKDYALLIATDQYDELDPLNNPVFDVNTIKQELIERYGFETKVLMNPTKSQLQEEIRSYSKREYSKTDQLLIFVAGHGVYDDVFKDGYIAARDSKKSDEIKDTYISYANFRNYVNNIPCSHILVVLDVCYGGTFNPAIASRGVVDDYSDIDRQIFISSKLRYRSRKYITSGGKVYVSDGVKGNHSPFARRFIEALRAGGGQDRILTFSEVIPFLETAEPSPSFGGFGNDEPGSDFIFIGSAGK